MNLFCLELQVDALMNFVRFLLSSCLSLLRSICTGLGLVSVVATIPLKWTCFSLVCAHWGPAVCCGCCSSSQVMGSNPPVALDTSVHNQRAPYTEDVQLVGSSGLLHCC